ncbi:MAG: hypothetical protein JWM28_2652 [Chitinophagaceae bacterium]|nr:hypothetical protein [Chitinophagaceae bacterium]
MATYLLLRNNKNSGPYSLEALIQLGLKPYDLVWVEGKSAAWRYPSEVEDLKFYAPVVEEQPYDRFYKKPSETKIETEKKQAVNQQPAQIQQEVNYITPQEVKQSIKIAEVKTPKKQVFVSLPANTGHTFIKRPEPVTAPANAQPVIELFNGNTDPVQKTEPAEAPSYSQLVNEYNNYQPREKKIVIEKEEPPIPKRSASVETKYAQSLDDIKDIYAQTLADRKRKTAQKKMIMKLVKRGLPFAAVLLVGFILGGFLMNRDSHTATGALPLQNNPGKIVLKADDKKDLPEQAVTPLTQPQQQEAVQQQLRDNASSANTKEAAFSKSSNAQKDLKLDKNSTTTQLPLNIVKKFVAKQNEAAKANNDNLSASLQKPQNIEADPKTGERSKIVRSATEDAGNNNTPAAPAKNGLLKQVNVKGNEYKVGTFGGIHDLQLTVVNNSNYLLDRVMVELQYLKASAQPLKTNNIQFENVPPNGSLTLAIPATNRGIKVTYKVINVQSKAAGNDTAGL